MSGDDDSLERRLANLETGRPGGRPARGGKGPALAVAVLGVVAILGLGTALVLAMEEDPEAPLPTATPDEFQTEGSAFGGVVPVVMAEEPRAAETPPEPDAALLALIETLQAQIEALRNAPEPVAEEDTAAAEAIAALSSQIAALQEASDAARSNFEDALARRDRTLRDLKLELDQARLEAQRPVPIQAGPSEAELAEIERQRLIAQEAMERQRRLAESAAARRAEMDRRRAEAAAFQEARIASPTIAFGNGGGGDGAVAERTFGEVTDFVLNGARPAQVTQAQVIANPGHTVIQGTMIQAVTETALDSALPGQIRAVVSEDVFSYDGSRNLIPRGSRLIGRYRSGLDVAQRRVTIAWDRIVLPNDQTVALSAFGGDELGRSGVSGHVDTRFGQRFGSAALLSLIFAVPDAAAGRVDDEDAADAVADMGGDLAGASGSVIGDTLSLGPVIHVDQGTRITVMVDRDLEIF